jgi:hypothetical protein
MMWLFTDATPGKREALLLFGRIGDPPQIGDAVMHGDIEKPRPPRRPAQPRENLLADLGILARLPYRGLDLKSR